MPKIGFSWEMIHQDIFDVFCPDHRDLDLNEFMKLIFPQDLFDSLFIKDDLYQAELVCAVYSGTPDGESVYQEMADTILSARSPGGRKYTFDNCPKILAFQRKWEELLPFTKLTAGAPNREEEENRTELKGIIEELMNDIPYNLTNIYVPLSLLIDQQKYSSVLAILSVMATALSQFEEKYSPLYDVVFPFIVGDRKRVKDPERPFDLLCASETKITWEMLHCRVFKRLRPEGRFYDRKYFLSELIPEELFKLLREKGDSDRETGKKVRKKDDKSKEEGKKTPKKNDKSKDEGSEQGKYLGYVYLGKKGAAARFRAVRDHIINQKSETGEPYTWDTSPFISHFRRKWETLLPETQYTAAQCEDMEDTAVRNMRTVLDCLLDSIPDDSQNVAARLRGITRSAPYSMVLAVLSMIASTLFCFAVEGQKRSAEDRILSDITLPPLPEKEPSTALQRARKMLEDPGKNLEDLIRETEPLLKDPVEKGEALFLLHRKAEQQGDKAKTQKYLDDSSNAGYQPALQKNNEKVAKSLMEEAQRLFAKVNESGFDSHCCTICEMILRMPTYIPKKYCADASYILYSCMASGWYMPKTGETAENYLEISYMYGHPQAAEEWKKRNTASITPYSSRSDCQTEGVCHCNAGNIFSAAFEKTIPDSWGGVLVPFDLTALEEVMTNPIHRRILLISDDFSQNLKDLFQVLQLIKKCSPEPEQLHWEFYVRHDSESVHALVDTALSRLAGYQIPVYILNDSKIAAQQLLSQHPLFYPIRALKLDKIEQTGNYRPLLHFVIIGNSPVTEWLVREAFWMMGFRNNVIRTKITVLAENGRAFGVSLKGRFPGMGRDTTMIEGIELAEIEGENVVLESAELQTKIQKFTEETPYCYFAVASDSDEGNLTLATRVREALIRTAIESQKEESLHQMPPVAFLCRDDQIAWLSKYMVVEKEKYGNLWFNTRALIPFGEISSRYSFDNISGGTFEQLAKCIHYQYNQLTPEEVLSGTEKAVAAQKDYYMRQYNQDSSYSMALGMPCRLFQFQDYNGVQVTPIGWNILQSSAFSSIGQLWNLASRMRVSEDTENWIIAEWEHARWVRWMLSRGWRGATSEESVFAYLSGNPRQQLFAAKMHPCICPYEAQKDLAKVLKKYGLNKDFYSSDYENVKATSQLLKLEWVLVRENEMER